jgi:hypothetical protein
MDQILSKVTRFIRLNPDCPLPVDLACELEAHGLNIEDVIESIQEEL